MAPESLSLAQARLLALRAQGLATTRRPGARAPEASGAASRQRTAVSGLLRDLGAVQLDTISVLARSHELVPMSRLGPVDRRAIHDAYWGDDGVGHANDASAFEYWSHAACILPVESWSAFAFRRRRYRDRWRMPALDADGLPPAPGLDASGLAGERTRVLAVLRAEGPRTATELGGAKREGQWWSWSATKEALEWLLAEGTVVCTRRSGWRRVYDLPERALPHDVLASNDLDDQSCHRHLLRESARTLGVGTIADLADVHRLPIRTVKDLAPEIGLVPVDVEGWGAAWADPAALGALGSDDGQSAVRSMTVLLSPFDSLVWFRDRVERLFGMTHRLEAYVPAAQRVHGYFAMPVLHRGSLVARVDPKREGSTLAAKRVVMEQVRGRVPTAALEGTARALRDAASWVGASDVRIEQVVPPTARERLVDLVSRS